MRWANFDHNCVLGIGWVLGIAGNLMNRGHGGFCHYALVRAMGAMGAMRAADKADCQTRVNG